MEQARIRDDEEDYFGQDFQKYGWCFGS